MLYSLLILILQMNQYLIIFQKYEILDENAYKQIKDRFCAEFGAKVYSLPGSRFTQSRNLLNEVCAMNIRRDIKK